MAIRIASLGNPVTTMKRSSTRAKVSMVFVSSLVGFSMYRRYIAMKTPRKYHEAEKVAEQRPDEVEISVDEVVMKKSPVRSSWTMMIMVTMKRPAKPKKSPACMMPAYDSRNIFVCRNTYLKTARCASGNQF